MNLSIVEVTCIDIELNGKVALDPLLQVLHGFHLLWVQGSLLLGWATRPPVAAATPDV